MARTKIDRRILKTKRSIICALLKLQKTTSTEAISVTALTNAADVNRKTFYLHYKSIGAVEEEFMQLLVSNLRETLQKSLNDETGVSARALFTNLQELIERYPDVFQALFSKNVMPKYLYSLQDQLVGNLESALESTHSCTAADLRNRIVFVTSGAVSVYMNWIYKAETPDLSSLTAQLSDFVVLIFSDCRK